MGFKNPLNLKRVMYIFNYIPFGVLDKFRRKSIVSPLSKTG